MILNENDLTNALSGKNILFPLGDFLSGEYPYHIASIANQVNCSGGQLFLMPYVLKGGRVIGPNVKKRAPHNPNSYSKTYLLELSWRYKVNILKTPEIDLTHNESILVQKMENLSDIANLDRELYYSIVSLWMSRNLLTLQTRKLSKREVKLLQGDVQDYLVMRRLVSQQLSINPIDLVIVPNGRTPEQVAIKHEAIAREVEYLHFERGFRRTRRLFLQPFQTQDVKAMNSYFAAIKRKSTEDQLSFAITWAKQWLSEQTSFVKSNPFIIFASRGQSSIDSGRGGLIVPLFTSSLDERFSNLGINLNGWESQNQALVATAQRILALGFKPLIRIHPNAGWKSWRELVELVAVLKDSNLDFILPWDSVSSYELIERAPFVVTWGSTLALESTARSIPTYNLGHSRFDSLIDLEVISGEKISEWIPNRDKKIAVEKSLVAIYVSRNFGLDLEGEEWVYLIDKEQSKRKVFGYISRTLLRLFIDFCRALFLPLNNKPYDLYFVLTRTLGKRSTNVLMLSFLRVLLLYYGVSRGSNENTKH